MRRTLKSLDDEVILCVSKFLSVRDNASLAHAANYVKRLFETSLPILWDHEDRDREDIPLKLEQSYICKFVENVLAEDANLRVIDIVACDSRSFIVDTILQHLVTCPRRYQQLQVLNLCISFHRRKSELNHPLVEGASRSDDIYANDCGYFRVSDDSAVYFPAQNDYYMVQESIYGNATTFTRDHLHLHTFPSLQSIRLPSRPVRTCFIYEEDLSYMYDEAFSEFEHSLPKLKGTFSEEEGTTGSTGEWIDRHTPLANARDLHGMEEIFAFLCAAPLWPHVNVSHAFHFRNLTSLDISRVFVHYDSHLMGSTVDLESDDEEDDVTSTLAWVFLSFAKVVNAETLPSLVAADLSPISFTYWEWRKNHTAFDAGDTWGSDFPNESLPSFFSLILRHTSVGDSFRKLLSQLETISFGLNDDRRDFAPVSDMVMRAPRRELGLAEQVTAWNGLWEAVIGRRPGAGGRRHDDIAIERSFPCLFPSTTWLRLKDVCCFPLFMTFFGCKDDVDGLKLELSLTSEHLHLERLFLADRRCRVHSLHLRSGTVYTGDPTLFPVPECVPLPQRCLLESGSDGMVSLQGYTENRATQVLEEWIDTMHIDSDVFSAPSLHQFSLREVHVDFPVLLLVLETIEHAASGSHSRGTLLDRIVGIVGPRAQTRRMKPCNTPEAFGDTSFQAKVEEEVVYSELDWTHESANCGSVHQPRRIYLDLKARGPPDTVDKVDIAFTSWNMFRKTYAEDGARPRFRRLCCGAESERTRVRLSVESTLLEEVE